MTTKKSYSLLNNSRFYVLAFSLLLSIAIFAWLRLSIPSDQLFYIRLQQSYGFVCLLYLYVALIISPLGHVIGKQRMKHLNFSRRGIGVSAFYFGLLHAGIALFTQLGGIDQLHYLPDIFKLSLAGGAIALVVLGLMAVTSFDKVITFMTLRRWKWLHRLVYASGILIILHIWMIGTHLAYIGMQIVGFSLLVILFGLELFRITKQLNRTYLRLSRAEAGAVFLSLWSIVIVLVLMIPVVIDNYHSRHADHDVHTQEVH